MLSSLPKIFDRSFVIGFILPVIIGLIGLVWIFPGLSVLNPLRGFSADEESLGKATYLLVALYACSILLVGTNTVQYRMLEGYYPPLKWAGRLRRRHENKRQYLYDRLNELKKQARIEGDEFNRDKALERNELWRNSVEQYPPLGTPVLPTRFGNVIRAFEAYPRVAYGADGVPTWLRLSTIVPKDVARALDDARALVNFFMNLFYILSALVFIGAFECVLFTPWGEVYDTLSGKNDTKWAFSSVFWVVLMAGSLVYPAYRLVVLRARDWGDMIKATFDTFLPTLVAHLGYASPTSEEDRRHLWRELNALFVFWQPVDDEVVKFGDRTPLDSEPPALGLVSLVKRAVEKLGGT